MDSSLFGPAIMIIIAVAVVVILWKRIKLEDVRQEQAFVAALKQANLLSVILSLEALHNLVVRNIRNPNEVTPVQARAIRRVYIDGLKKKQRG